MSSISKTHLNRAYYPLDSVIYLMNEVIKGRTAKELRKHLVEDDPFSNSSREYRSIIANWLITDYVSGFSKGALPVFARIMTSDSIDPTIKRELLFWKTCERDRLAREITIGPVYTAYYRSEPFIFIDDLIHTAIAKIGLAKSTGRKCVNNYLSIAKKIGFIDYGENGLQLNFFRPKQNSIAAVLYFLFESGLSAAKILQADDFKYLLVDERTLISTLADLNAAGMIEFAMTGNVVRLEPKIAFEVLPDALKG